LQLQIHEYGTFEGHGFSRAGKAVEEDAALAAGECLLSKVNYLRAKARQPCPVTGGTAEAV
jgi:hypothetical protein